MRTHDEDGQQRWPWQAPRDRSCAVLHSGVVSAGAPSNGGVGGMWLCPELGEPRRSRVWLSTGSPRAAGALVGLGFERGGAVKREEVEGGKEGGE